LCITVGRGGEAGISFLRPRSPPTNGEKGKKEPPLPFLNSPVNKKKTKKRKKKKKNQERHPQPIKKSLNLGGKN